ncbi:MAG: hypothetical protein O7E52_01045 [Candidatus Poribacteria bacterium]|nr:hypothetical protein [Candidatus Poribacteria bacterium]
MPSINKSMFVQLTKIFFVAKMIKLPTDWKSPPDQKQYPDAFKPSERTVMPNMPLNLFREQTLNKYHVDTARDIGKEFESYIEDICDGICFGIDLWRLQAKFTNLKVMAVCAIGTPGCLTGPKLKSLICMSPSTVTHIGQKKKYTDAIAKAFSDAWDLWSSKVMIPGLPFYPAFAAFPGPMAPPMPNVPFPLIACPSAAMAELVNPNSLKKKMEDNLGDSDALHAPDLFDAIAQGFAVVFLMWLPMQQVMNVLGKGPIPTFAPPFVPVGPVVGGDNLPIPGHLAL